MDAPEELPVAGTVVLLRDGADAPEVLLLRRPERGSFAGGWVFPGGKVEEADRRLGAAEIDDARRAGIRETSEEVSLEVTDLVALSQWHPPAEAPTRIRTWFFLAPAPADARIVASPDEVAAHTWITPAEALARHAAGEWTLFPPTWVTLHRLSRFPDADAALAAAGAPALFRTQVVETAEGRDFVWEHGRLVTASLPWRFDEA